MKPSRAILLPKVMVFAFCLLFVPFEGMATENETPIVLKTMGSVFFGGKVTKNEKGETFHSDHGYAQYYVPQKSRNYPLVLWHGIGQSGRTFESTPDGREGFQAIFTRHDWPVYIIDQPRVGRAGRTLSSGTNPKIPTTSIESGAWNAFRLGLWLPPQGARFFPEVQFPQDGYSIDQFLRQQTPATGEEPNTLEYKALMGQTTGELFKMIGPGILITHSNSGQYGWTTGMATPGLIKAIVAYEPAGFSFPESDPPADFPIRIPLVAERLKPQLVPSSEFQKLTRIPIVIYYGDNIAREPSDIFAVEVWRVALKRAKQFVDAINRHGGNAKLVVLPEIGIRGNTHFPFADLNNIEIANLLESWLHNQRLDGRDNPHTGPKRKPMKVSFP